ncbi:MAG: metal-dependent phosphohydrolase, partial [Chloroflexi bacterium]
MSPGADTVQEHGTVQQLEPPRTERARSIRNVLRLALFGLFFLIVTVGAVAISWGRTSVQLQVGDIARETIKAPETASYISAIRTEDRRQEAFADERNIAETYDETIRSQQVAEVQRLLKEIDAIRADDTKTAPAKATEVRAIANDLDEEQSQSIVSMSQASWTKASSEAVRLVSDTLSSELRSDEVARVKEDLGTRATPALTLTEQTAAVALAKPFIRANVFIDEAQTLANRQAAANAVEPVLVTVQAGQALVRDGDPVTALDIERLEQLGLLQNNLSTSERLGKSGLMVILAFALLAYLYVFSKRLWEGRQLAMLALVIATPIVVARIALPDANVQYILPVAATAMLLAVLLDFQFALVVSSVLALALGVVAGMSFELVFVYFIASATGAFLIWRAERTITFVWAGLGVALATFAVAVCFKAIADDVTSAAVARLAFQSALAGALSASVTFLSFSLLGSLFGITTHLQLLELAHPNQPLLYRLAREAPGTYHHSIVVSNLAETGVELVGGDPLFTRVAVLYHDIGKIVRPTFFVENQANRENPHDLLDPRTSASVIIDHVIDGVRLAKRARLPRPIIDIIEQHHGTTLIRYFYGKALESGEEVSEDEFRYPGPKPRTKEAGVIMLADSVEAAVR